MDAALAGAGEMGQARGDGKGKVKVQPSTPRPCVKWAGGKRELWPEIRKHVPARFNSYYEPFLGGGAVFFALVREGRLEGLKDGSQGAFLNDANVALVNVYKVVRDSPKELLKLLHGHKNTKESYLATRARNFMKGSAAERAADFLICNRTGFNGLYRVNKSGQFNVPHGRYPEDVVITDPENLEAVSKCFREAKALELLNVDFEEVTKQSPRNVEAHVKGAFFYFDPPYIPLSKTSDFTTFAAGGFKDEDQVRLRDFALRLKKAGAHVVLSNSSAPRVRELYEGSFDLHEVMVTRAINSKVGKRGPVAELLIT